MSINTPLTVDQGASLIQTFVYIEDVNAETWAAGNAYELDAVVVPTASTGYVYTATEPGISAATEPTFPTTLSTTVIDGSVVWTCSGPNVQPINLTGYSAYMQIRSAPQATDLEASITTTLTSQGVITLGGSAGTVSINVTGETTAALTNPVYYYDLFLVDGSDNRTMLVRGKISVNLYVTIIP